MMHEIRITKDGPQIRVAHYTRFRGTYQLLWVDSFTSKFKFFINLLKDLKHGKFIGN